MGPRFAIMAPPGAHYVAATWASWLSGGVAVPLCLTHPIGYAGPTPIVFITSPLKPSTGQFRICPLH